MFENTDSKGRFTIYVSNVVLNVNTFLVIRSIKPPFGFELILENASKILNIKRIQTITWVPIDMSNSLFEAIRLKIPIPGDDCHCETGKRVECCPEG